MSAAQAASGGPFLRLRRMQPATLVFTLAVLILAFMIVVPVARLVISSFQVTDGPGLTLDNYATAWGQSRNLTAVGNSLLYALAVTVLSAIFAVPMAWGVSRTDMPCKGLIRALIIGAFITPSYLGAVGWILLGGPNAGWLNHLWMWLSGSDHGFMNIYSFGGLVLVTALYSFPYIFVFTSAALDLVSSEMEEAASILGSGWLHTIRRVTLPLVLPAIMGGAIIVFLDTIALFGTPAIIALPARIPVLTLVLWQYFEFPIRVEVAAAYAIPLIVVTLALFSFQRLALGRKGYVALTGKGGVRNETVLGRWRWAVLGYALFVVGLAVILPYAALAQAAFSRAWGQGLSWANFTLSNFSAILLEDGPRATILRTFGYSAVAATAAVLLSLVIAYIVTRRMVRDGGLLTLLSMAPLVIPGIVLGIAFYGTYAPPPIALYGTAAILIISYTTRFMPVAYVNASSGIRSLNPEMEDAVRILGGGRLKALSRVVIPLLKVNLIGSWLLVFIPASRELSTALFLVTGQTRVISVMMLDFSENGSFETLAALGFVLLTATIAIVLLGYKLVGRDFMLRRS